MSAVYSATLFVATPMVSLTDARWRAGSRLASSTTAPIPAGPGFPRDPPSQKIRIVLIAGSRPGKGSVLTVSGSRARDEDGAAVVAVGDVALGAGLADAGDLGGRDRQATSLARVAHEPRHPDASRRGTAPVVHREQIGGDAGGRRRPGVGLGGDLGVDDALLLGHGGPGGLRLGLGRLDPAGELGELAVDRLLALHELELTVLERALVPAQLLDLALHRLQLAW